MDKLNIHIGVGVDPSGARTAYSKISAAAKEMAHSSSNSTTVVSKASAILTQNIIGVAAAFATLRDASKAALLEKGLETQSARLGISLRAVAKDVQTLTKYSINYRDAMEATSMVSSAGFGSDITRRLTKAAANSAIGLGRNMTDAMDRMIKGVVKLEPELLDELGIMTKLNEATSKYARATGKAESSLTSFEKRQAFLNAVLEESETKFGGLIDAIDTNPYDKLSASVVDLTRDGLNFLNYFLNPSINLLAESKPLLASIGLLLGSTMAKLIAPEMYNQAAAKLQLVSKLESDYADKLKTADADKAAHTAKYSEALKLQQAEIKKAAASAANYLNLMTDPRVRSAMEAATKKSLVSSETSLKNTKSEATKARLQQEIDDKKQYLKNLEAIDAGIANQKTHAAMVEFQQKGKLSKSMKGILDHSIENSAKQSLAEIQRSRSSLLAEQSSLMAANELLKKQQFKKNNPDEASRNLAKETLASNKERIAIIEKTAKEYGKQVITLQTLNSELQKTNAIHAAGAEISNKYNETLRVNAHILLQANRYKHESATLENAQNLFAPGALGSIGENYKQSLVSQRAEAESAKEAKLDYINSMQSAGKISESTAQKYGKLANISAAVSTRLYGIGLAARVAGTAFLNAIPIIGQVVFALSLIGAGVKMAIDYFHPAGKVIAKATDDVKENIKTLQDVGKQVSSIFSMTSSSAAQSAQAILGVSNAIGALAESYKTLQAAKMNAAKYDALNGPFKDSEKQGPSLFNKWFSVEYKSIKALRETGYAPLIKDIEDATTNSEVFNKSNGAGQRLIMGKAIETLGKKYANAGIAIQEVSAASKQLMTSAAEFTKASKISTPYDSISEALVGTIQSVTNLRAEMIKGSITAEEFNKQLSSIASNPLLAVDTTRLQSLTESLTRAKDALKRQQDEMRAKYSGQESVAAGFKNAGKVMTATGSLYDGLGTVGRGLDYLKAQRPDYSKDAKIEKALGDLQNKRVLDLKKEQEAVASIVSEQLTAQYKIVSQLQNQHALSASIIELENTRFSKAMKYAQGTAAGIIMQAEHQNKLAAQKISQLDAEYSLQMRLHASTMKAAIDNHDMAAKNSKEKLDAIDQELKIQLSAYELKNNLENANHETIMRNLDEQIKAQQDILNSMNTGGWAGFWASLTHDRTQTVKTLAGLNELKNKSTTSETDKIISDGNFERAKQEAEIAKRAAENIKLQAKIARESMADMGDAMREARTQAAENVKTQLLAAVDNAKVLLDVSEQLAAYNTNSLRSAQQELYVSKLKANNEMALLEAKFKIESKARASKLKELAGSTIQNEATKEALRIAQEADKSATAQFNIEKERIKLGLYLTWMEKARVDVYKEGLELQQNQLSVYSKMLDMVHSIRDQEAKLNANRMKLTNLRAGGDGEFSAVGQKFMDAAEANRAVLAARESYKLKVQSIKLEYALLYAQQAALEGELIMRRQMLAETGQGTDTMFKQLDAAISGIRNVNISALESMAISNAKNDVGLAGQNADIAQFGLFGDRSPGPKLGMTMQSIQEWLFSIDARNNARDVVTKPTSAVTYSKDEADKEIKAANDKIFSAIQSVKADPHKISEHIKDITNAKATTTIWVGIASDISAIRTSIEKGAAGGMAGYNIGNSSNKDIANGIVSLAQWAKVSPEDLAALIALETSGTFNPAIKGGKGNNYQGLIQFGSNERRKYDLNSDSDFRNLQKQFTAIQRFLSDRGFKPGMGIAQLYSTINAGSPGHLGRSDGFKLAPTVIDKVKLFTNPNSGYFKKGVSMLGGSMSNPIYTKSANDNAPQGRLETVASSGFTDVGGSWKEILSKEKDSALKQLGSIGTDLVGSISEVVIVVGDLAKSIGGLNKLTEAQKEYITKWAAAYESINSEWVAGQGSAIDQLYKLGDAAGGLGPALARATKGMLELFSPQGTVGGALFNGKSVFANAKQTGINAVFGPQADKQNQDTITAAMESYKKEHGGSSVGFDASKVGGMVSASDVAREALPANKKLAESYGVLSTAASAFASISTSISGILEANSNRRIANIDAEIAAEQRRDGKSAQSLEKIKALEAKKDAIARKQFEMNKKIQMAQTVVNTASAVVGALAQGGPILGPILAGMIGALGAAQLAIISSTQYQSASAASSFTAPSLSIGKIGNSVDLGKGPNANAGGEVGYLRGQTGTGNNANNYRTIGSAYGGNPLRGYGNRGIIVGEKGPERLEVIGGSAHITSNAELQQQSTTPLVQNITIQAIDSDSFTNFAKNNAGSLIEGIRHVANNQGQEFMENINTGAYKRKAAGRL